MITENLLTLRLRGCLDSCLEISRRENLDDITTAIQDVKNNLESPMQLAIIGKVSSSKSTLVNAILGKADIVGTGQMEETFNVSWLKYGSPDNDIRIVFKDGSSSFVPRREWKKWSGQEQNLLKEKVSYLEVTYDHEILKQINIIDTPGLDSAKGIDSKNTIEFLSNVRPDAVMMVFTKGLAQSTLDVVKEFQGKSYNSFSMSPLNAIGLLSKTDYLWHVNKAESKPNQKAQRDVIDGNIFTLFPEVKKSLYSIYPICSILGLASHTVNSHDIMLIKSLSLTNWDDLKGMLHSVNDFLDEYFVTEISIDERKHLYQKFGLYGIYEAISLAKSNNLDEVSLKRLYREVSGIDILENCLYNHFGQRSLLIKTQSMSQIISLACERQRVKSKVPSENLAVDKIQESVLSCLMNIFEYKQLATLTKLYENKMNTSDISAVEEYKRICGEYGSSAVSKLGMKGEPQPTIEEMLFVARNKKQEWNAKYHLYYNKSGNTKELYKMLFNSYDMLEKDIEEVENNAKNAQKVLSMANSFFYGK